MKDICAAIIFSIIFFCILVKPNQSNPLLSGCGLIISGLLAIIFVQKCMGTDSDPEGGWIRRYDGVI